MLGLLRAFEIITSAYPHRSAVPQSPTHPINALRERTKRFNMSIDILKESDYAQWAETWRLYLEFYETTLPESQYKNTWSRLMDPHGDLEAFVVRDEEGNIVGLAHYLFHYWTWSHKPLCYLNDLFVHKDVRGKGYGRKLIEATAKAAREHPHGCFRFYWATAETNATARRLYDSVAKVEFLEYSMSLKE